MFPRRASDLNINMNKIIIVLTMEVVRGYNNDGMGALIIALIQN